MNDIIRSYIENFVIVYLDDILIYSCTWEDHVNHVQNVFQLLQQEQLWLNRKKCEFGSEALALLLARYNLQTMLNMVLSMRMIQILYRSLKISKVANLQNTIGKIWYDEDIHDLISVETKFLAIAFNDEVSSETLSCEPTVSAFNNDIDFRISFDDSDDEDYTVIFEKNLFSYKIISTNDLKTDSENDNEKVMPLLPSHEPTISCLDDLVFFKDFENEFRAIVYNDAQTSKSDLLTEPILSPPRIDEFDLNGETSLSKYDEEEQNILYFNDLFPFNIIHPDDLKSKKTTMIMISI
ncbi:putative reverse transcriptase domain-containing protein [Tanacetum coccineum]